MARVFSPWEATDSRRRKFHPVRAAGLMLPAAALPRPGRVRHSPRGAGSAKPRRLRPVLGEAGRHRDPLDRENSRSEASPAALGTGSPASAQGSPPAPQPRCPRRAGALPSNLRRARGAERGAEAPPSARGPRDSPAACETRAAPAPFCAAGLRRRPGLDSRYHGRVGGRRRGPAPYGERAARPLRPGAAGRGSDVVDGQEFV